MIENINNKICIVCQSPMHLYYLESTISDHFFCSKYNYIECSKTMFDKTTQKLELLRFKLAPDLTLQWNPNEFVLYRGTSFKRQTIAIPQFNIFQYSFKELQQRINNLLLLM